MKYFTFGRSHNNFTDILTDPSVKKVIDEVVTWHNHLMIGMQDVNEGTFSYITLKYGDDIVTDLTPDYSPIPNKDYTPTRKLK